jgi:hypothetical protein
MTDMKVNYRRTVSKQREREHQRKLKEREEMLSKMSDEEREKYLEDEQKRIKDTLGIMSMAQAMLGDNPYSKL